jgi:hypothetical protein
LAVGTVLVFLVPAVGMLFTNEIQWRIGDFVIMGFMLFGFGSLFIFLARKASVINRVYVAALVLFGFIVVWAELAVGIFTDIGS